MPLPVYFINCARFNEHYSQLDAKIAELEGMLHMLEREKQLRFENVSEYDAVSSGKTSELQLLLHLPETLIDNEDLCTVNRFEQEYRRLVKNNLIPGGVKGGFESRFCKSEVTETRRRTKSVLSFRGVTENSFSHMPLMARFSTDTDETNSDICPDLDTDKSVMIERNYVAGKESDDTKSSRDGLSVNLPAIMQCNLDMRIDCRDDEDDDEYGEEIHDNDEGEEDEMTVLALRRSLSAMKANCSGSDIPSTSEPVEMENLNPEEETLITEMQDLQLRLLQLNGKSNMIFYV